MDRSNSRSRCLRIPTIITKTGSIRSFITTTNKYNLKVSYNAKNNTNSRLKKHLIWQKDKRKTSF